MEEYLTNATALVFDLVSKNSDVDVAIESWFFYCNGNDWFLGLG